MKEGDEPAEELLCPSCGVTTLPEARFCHSCGASLVSTTGSDKWLLGGWPGLVTAAGLVAIAVFVTMALFSRNGAEAPTPPVFDLPPPATSGGPPDLSQMTLAEAANRLFNRVMMASEQGNRREALDFVPMAIQAYEELPAPDRDARYHLGLMYLIAGNRSKVDQQIAALREGAPDHLLAFELEYKSAVESGDSAAISRILSAFAAAYEAEMEAGRPEYAAHREAIEALMAATQ